MECTRCQHENEAGAKFCEECAAPLARACAKCGRQLSPAAKFCPECAQPTGLPAAPPPVQRFGSPESYTPKHLAERILTSKTALEGERKQVTVLFADLKGSMELLADRDPEEARKLLDPVLERMMEAVHRYEGTVNQVMGDGIMALFGAPLAHEDHAVRACYAALRMQESVKRYAEGVRREEGVPIRIRVGLNSGEVVVRAISSDLHMDYTAVGQTTHLAARMEQLAEPGTALLTSATLALAEDFVQVKSLGPMRVRGLSEAIEVYELAGANPVRSRFHAHAARGLTKFVGRTSEVSQLGETLDLTRSGRGQVIAVVGEPGVGKSRLFWEFAHSHRTDRCLVIEAASVSYGKATPYLPVIELLRVYFQIESRDDVRKIREKVTGKLLSLDRALEPTLPALLALLDVPVDDPQWTRLDPPQRRQRTLDAVKRLLLRESHVQPLVVIFEDLHWIDGETQAVLDGLVESLPTARMLVLVNYRPEYQHPWGSKTYYRQVRLDALPSASAEELLAALLGHDPSLELLKRLLIERTEGNPFFLEESVRTLVETTVLAGQAGAYRLTRAPAGLQIPATAQAIVAARIDRLELEDKRLLQAASVIGKDVPLALLEAIADMAESGLRQSLARLQAAEFIYEIGLYPDLEYSFKHALTHEVTYGGLLQERRRAYHARIVDALERLYAGRLVEQVERLGYHALRAEAWAGALEHSTAAGDKAFGRSAYREAVTLYEQALGALDHLPETRSIQEQAIDLHLKHRNALFPLGEPGRIAAHLGDAERIAIALGDTHRLGWVLVYESDVRPGDPRPHFERIARALEIGRTHGDHALEITATVVSGTSRVRAGDFEGADAFLRQAIALADSGPLRELYGLHAPPAVMARGWLGLSLAERGRFDDAVAVGHEAVGIAGDAEHPYSTVHARLFLSRTHLMRGDFDRVVEVADPALAVATQYGYFLAPILAGTLLLACAMSARREKALGFLNAGAGTTRYEMGGPELGLWRAEAMLALGHAGEMRAAIETAVTSIRSIGRPALEAAALRLLGEVRAEADSDPAAAEAAYRSALELAEQRGMRPLVAHCHLGLGRLDGRMGKHAEAHEHLTIATTMYREMGMTYWLEKAEAEMRGLA